MPSDPWSCPSGAVWLVASDKNIIHRHRFPDRRIQIAMDLTGKLLSREQRLFFYGTTPPRLDSPSEVVDRAAERLAERLLGRDIDAIVVYDIQDESGRTQVERRFPFTETVDPREFASRLRQLTGRPTITYRGLGTLAEIAWRAWLDESAKDPEFRALSIVGRPTSGITYELPLAN